jgi:hypothetical protein
MSLNNFITHASQAATISGFKKIKRDYISGNQILPASNPLKVNPEAAVGYRGTRYSISGDDTKAYLAASSLTHCMDGWNYVSNAIDSLINGEKHIAVHMAYYAELRAAMSFLATEGIGIFNANHVSANHTNRIMRSPDLRRGTANLNGTHQFLWESLASWIANKDASNTLNYFQHNGKTFAEWIAFLPHANPAVISVIVKDWLKDWTFDINNYKLDRSGRNSFSYRPTRINDLTLDNLDDKLVTTNSYWQTLEPIGSNRFALLDKFLFKHLFDKIHTMLRQNGSTLSITQLLDQTFINAGIPMDRQLHSFISTNQTHKLLSNSKDMAVDSHGHAKPFSVIARALLMLRFSSGATSHLMKIASISQSDLQFFWEGMGVDCGFWEPGSCPTTFNKLWDLVNDSMTDIEDWRTTTTRNVNLKSFHEEEISSAPYFTQFNRAALWGAGL